MDPINQKVAYKIAEQPYHSAPLLASNLLYVHIGLIEWISMRDGSESEEPIARNPGLSSKSSNRFDASKCDGPGSALAAGKKRQEIRIQVEKDVSTEQSVFICLRLSDAPFRSYSLACKLGTVPTQWIMDPIQSDGLL